MNARKRMTTPRQALSAAAMAGVLLSFALALFLVVSAPIPASATENYQHLAPIEAPGSEFKKGVECKGRACFPQYVRTLYNVGIALAGIFAVMKIVQGGFTLMWTDSYLNRLEAKGIILRALGGLLIVYSSYVLLNLVSPSLGRDLDLSLNYGVLNIKQAKSPLVPLTDAQIKSAIAGKFAEATNKTFDKVQIETGSLREQAAGFMASAEQAATLKERDTFVAQADELLKTADFMDAAAGGKFYADQVLREIQSIGKISRDPGKIDAGIQQANRWISSLNGSYESGVHNLLTRNDFDGILELYRNSNGEGWINQNLNAKTQIAQRYIDSINTGLGGSNSANNYLSDSARTYMGGIKAQATRFERELLELKALAPAGKQVAFDIMITQMKNNAQGKLTQLKDNCEQTAGAFTGNAKLSCGELDISIP